MVDINRGREVRDFQEGYSLEGLRICPKDYLFIHPEKPHIELSTFDVAIHREVIDSKVLPRGSALITSSGQLSAEGIVAIVHAASGSRYQKTGNFKPNLQGIKDSIKNSFILAERHIQRNPHLKKKIAIPFIGAKAFLGSIQEDVEDFDKYDLAEMIVRASFDSCGDFDISFVAYTLEDVEIFRFVLGSMHEDVVGRSDIVDGSITDFFLHECPIIVNAANMEVEFGSGVAYAIGKATGNGAAIDQEARELIDFYLSSFRLG